MMIIAGCLGTAVVFVVTYFVIIAIVSLFAKRVLK